MCKNCNNDGLIHHKDIEVSRRQIIKQLIFLAISTLSLIPLSKVVAETGTIKIGGKEYIIVSDPQEFVEGLSGGKQQAIVFQLKDYLQLMKQLNDVSKRKSINFLERNKSMDIASIKCGLVVPNFVKMRLMGIDAVNVGTAKDWVDYKCPRCGSGTVIMFQF